MDEHEQGERVRSWLRQNGGAILGGIALGLVAIFGWQMWQGAKLRHKLDAATLYQAMEMAAQEGEAAQVERLSGELAERYDDTLYGALGLLRLAEQKQAAGDLEAASQALKRAADLAGKNAVGALARLRLAQVELAAGRAQEALAQLDAIGPDDYAGLAAEVRGDALLLLGRSEDAIAAYRTALKVLDSGAATRGVVMMKLADLGASADAPEV